MGSKARLSSKRGMATIGEAATLRTIAPNAATSRKAKLHTEPCPIQVMSEVQ